MVLVPVTKQVGAVELIVGTAGVTNTAALLNGIEAPEVQLPFDDITVYEVPITIPVTLSRLPLALSE